MGGGDEIAMPETKGDIVPLCPDRCALDHEGICSVR